MSTSTILYLIIAGIIALSLALFLYNYKPDSGQNLNILFIFLRFITIFSVLLLIINPKFEHLNFYSEKPKLIVAVDNSTSIKNLNQEKNALNFVSTISNSAEINNKFNVDYYTFDNSLKVSDSIKFSENETNFDD